MLSADVCRDVSMQVVHGRMNQESRERDAPDSEAVPDGDRQVDGYHLADGVASPRDPVGVHEPTPAVTDVASPVTTDPSEKAPRAADGHTSG